MKKNNKDDMILGIQIKWWKSKCKYYHISGTFNHELYIKILEAKIKDK